MNVLVIGGTNNVGYRLVGRLIAAGHRVTLLNRGLTPDPFGNRVRRLIADRTTDQFRSVLSGQEFDAAVDFVAFRPEDAAQVVSVLGSGRVGHYIFISTGQVYLVRTDCPVPSRELDFDGPVMPAPTEESEYWQWRYGADKRAAETILENAWRESGFPVTRLRIPKVLGERDERRRLDSYLWRLLDGGPVLVPTDGNQICHCVYSAEVARAIAGLLGKASTYGEAYNLAQDERPTLTELLTLMTELLGAPSRLMPVTAAQLATVGLRPGDISPLSKGWASQLDTTKAKRDLQFSHEPLREYLGKILSFHLNHPPAELPDDYRHRPLELELAKTLAE
jgi:nucleoside-diphosphate-sugar epimerase